MEMKGRKMLFLMAALAAPVAVFLFLKFFGRNEFAVEPLFRDGVPETGCAQAYRLPYLISDSVRGRLPFDESVGLAVIAFPGRDSTGTAGRNLRRVEDAFSNDPVAFVRLPVAGNDLLRECIFFLVGDFSAAVVDRDGAIRGRYTLSDLEDTDRLSVELKIMLRKY